MKKLIIVMGVWVMVFWVTLIKAEARGIVVDNREQNGSLLALIRQSTAWVMPSPKPMPIMQPRPTFVWPNWINPPTSTPKTNLNVTPTKTPTLTPTPLATLRISPTASKTPTPSPTLPTSSTTQPNTSVQQYLIDRVNAYRASQGLGAVAMDSYTCNFAQIRAREIASRFNHDGFSNRIHNKSLPYPSYSYITENIAMTSDYRKVVEMWINSSGHAANMRANTPYVCVAQYGNYYAYEGWRP